MAKEIHKGDLVTPSLEFVGHGHVFEVKEVNTSHERCIIDLLKEDIKNGQCPLTCSTVTWLFSELYLIRTIESMDKEYYEEGNKNFNQIKEETAQQFFNKKTLPIFYANREKSNKVTTWQPFMTSDYLELNNEKGEINMLKLLEIYKEKQTIEIESKYDEQLENLRKEDPVTVLKEQFEAAIKELLELKGEERVAISVTSPVVELTPETIEKQREIANIIREEKKKINRKIEEIEALLELAPNYEEKIKILRDYEIIDKKKNIIL